MTFSNIVIPSAARNLALKKQAMRDSSSPRAPRNDPPRRGRVFQQTASALNHRNTQIFAAQRGHFGLRGVSLHQVKRNAGAANPLPAKLHRGVLDVEPGGIDVRRVAKSKL